MKNPFQRPLPDAYKTIDSVALVNVEPPRALKAASSRIQVKLKDGRSFCFLACTPEWFERRFSELDLPFYFGPSIVFLREMTPKNAEKAVRDMLQDEHFLKQHDIVSPERTLDELLQEFKQRHFQKDR